MPIHPQLNRRRLLRNAALSSAAVSIGGGIAAPLQSLADTTESNEGKPWLRKTLKFGMIKHAGSLTDKFNLAKSAGFEGVELNVPLNKSITVEAAREASEASGVIIDGTVGGYHGGIRHTDPDPAVRAKALEKLKTGIRETAAVGGDTMLLVPGHGKDGSDDEVQTRAVEAITAALPVAEEHKVAILIENVWNDFCYDHEGDENQTADRLLHFIDRFDSPLVGVQYDIGNHWKYGDPAAWIRTLGHRIQKLDIKGFSRKSGKFTKITEGDIDWPSVEQALRDIKFSGWLAAEVGGGDLKRLKEVSDHLEESLNCSKSVASAS